MIRLKSKAAGRPLLKSPRGGAAKTREARRRSYFTCPDFLETRKLLSRIAFITGMSSRPSDPWDISPDDPGSDSAAMDAAFGVDNRDRMTFDDAISRGITTAGRYEFLFLDGIADYGSIFENFLDSNGRGRGIM